MADLSLVANQTASAEVSYYTSGIRQFLIKGKDECVDVDGDQDRAMFCWRAGRALYRPPCPRGLV